MDQQIGNQPPAGAVALCAARPVPPMGANTLINFHLGDTSVLGRLDAYANEQPGAELNLLVDMNRAILVDPESEKVL